jgi:hypothetical protein
MFSVPPLLKEKMRDRIDTLPVNAHALLVAAGVGYDEHVLPTGVFSTLRMDADGTYRVCLSSSLKSMARNQVCAHTLAHLLLHSSLFEAGDCHVDKIPGTPAPFPCRDPLDASHDQAANALGVEILIPTIALRSSMIYHEGKTAAMAAQFQVPASLVQQAMIQAGFLDPRAKIA